MCAGILSEEGWTVQSLESRKDPKEGSMAFFNATMGLRTEGDDVVLDTKPEHQVTTDLIHFAVLTTVCEVAAAKAAGVAVVPAQISVNLIRPAKPGRIVGRGRVIKVGKRLAVVEGEASQEGEVVAKATVTFAVL
jgi:uncharacterized protein (TIGR00369 family)